MLSRYLIVISFFLLPWPVLSQKCSLWIEGRIHDAGTGQAISYANVQLQEQQTGAVTDSLGRFKLTGICPGHYHLLVSHIGCESKIFYLDLQRDTLLELTLHHNSQLLDEIEISGKSQDYTVQKSQSIQEKAITENADNNLGNLLQNIVGVRSLKSGSSIAKPVIHGLYGNRITILNNGIAQNGQQWGADHSPEIDPLQASSIRVIKGVAALQYPGASLGGMIMLEPEKILKEPHLHGALRYFFASNGLGNGLNLQLQQYRKWLAWKVSGTMKMTGDKQASDYYLNNTGSREGNFSVQLESAPLDKLSHELYISSFNTEIGVLRGSHIGNTTDLKDALKRKEPFYTEDYFSYQIHAPRQEVSHHLLKFHTRYYPHENHKLDFTFAGQMDKRQEYDVRRGGRTESPALSLKQYSQYLEACYKWRIPNLLDLNTGVQYEKTDNENQPETGIIPLIPDYISYETGFFMQLKKEWEKGQLELGARYDELDRRVVAISPDIPREILRYRDHFKNWSLAGGMERRLTGEFVMAFNMGYVRRSPEINELYSQGLHQGVSGIEEGDAGLLPERSTKVTLSLDGKSIGPVSFEALIFAQQINNFIFLKPMDEFRLTIRGAFPVFSYSQTDAQIYGVDLSGYCQFNKALNLVLKYSLVRGANKLEDLPLTGMPSDRLYNELNYQVALGKGVKNLELQLNQQYVFKQQHLHSDQDFAPAPDAFYLIGLKISGETQIVKFPLRIFLRVDNLLNTKYRDYLNRHRYFADDQGINLVLGCKLSF